MGWLSIGGSSQSQATNQTTTPVIPAWVQNSVMMGVNAGQEISQRPFTPYTGQLTAGLDPMQAQARDLATTTAGGWQPAVAGATAAANRGIYMTPRDVNAPNMFTQTAQAAPQAAVQGVTAASGATGMGAYTNPWQSQVTDAALAAIRRQGDKAQAQLGQRAAASGAFGGSREAILAGEIERGVQETSADTAGRIASEGFTTAAGLAQQDAERGLTANMFTSGAFNDAAESAAGRGQQASLFNAGAFNDTTRAQTQHVMDAQLANQGADAATAGRALTGAGVLAGIGDMTGAQGRADVGMFGALGAEGRDVTQAQLDAAYAEWMRGQNHDIDNYRLLLEGIYGAPFDLFRGQNTTGTTRGRGMSLLLGG